LGAKIEKRKVRGTKKPSDHANKGEKGQKMQTSVKKKEGKEGTLNEDPSKKRGEAYKGREKPFQRKNRKKTRRRKLEERKLVRSERNYRQN